MEDIEILKQLLNGNHLEPKEVERAKTLVRNMNLNLNNRT